MIAFEVSQNGRHICTAGAGDGVVSVTLTWSKRKDAPSPENHVSFHVGGLSGEEYLDWHDQSGLRPGDEIQLRIVETEAVDRPLAARRDDAAVVEASERKQYERLKAKFEPGPHDSQ